MIQKRRVVICLIVSVALLGGLGGGPATAVKAQDATEVQLETAHLGGNVYMMRTGAGGNLAACAGDDGVLLVDSEYKQLSERVRASVAKISEKPVGFILNTHWHFDHVGGNEHFANKGSVVIAHENVRTRMSTGQLITIIDTDVPASPGDSLPIITFPDAVSFHLNEEEITVLHMPSAHTDGDAVVHFKEANVLHTGDIVFAGGYPFIDISSGGSIDGVIAALGEMLEICDNQTKIVPGHGTLMDRTGLEKYRQMLSSFRSAIAAEIAAGKDLPAVLEAKPTGTIDEEWGKLQFPPETFTEIVYLSLTAK